MACSVVTAVRVDARPGLVEPGAPTGANDDESHAGNGALVWRDACPTPWGNRGPALLGWIRALGERFALAGSRVRPGGRAWRSMTQAMNRDDVRRAILGYLDRHFPDRVIDERSYDDGRASDIELYPFWIAQAPEALRVFVSREALDQLARACEGADAVSAWLDRQALAATVAQGRDVMVTSGGVAADLEPE